MMSSEAVQDAVYEVFAGSTDAIIKRIDAIDREIHEHGPDCEMRCPREQLRSMLMDCIDEVGRASEPYFRATTSEGKTK